MKSNKRANAIFYVLMLCTAFFAVTASAATPVESVIIKYADVKGVRQFEAKGVAMKLARGLIRKTPAAPVADYVDELSVLRVDKADSLDRTAFVSDLYSALSSYDYVGKAEAPNGIVDVYVSKPQGEFVKEFVVYNQEIYSINSLRGDIPVSTLLSMKSQILPVISSLPIRR